MDRGAWKATSPRGHKESDMTEQLKHFHSIQVIRALPVFLPAGLIASLTTWWIWSSGAYMLFLQMPAHQQVLLLLFRHSVVFESLRPHGLQHNRLPCPSLSPRVCSNSCPLSRWCHPTISFSVTPFSSCPQSIPASESFPMSQLFTSGGQSIGASDSTLSPSNEYSGLISFRIDWFDLLAVQGTLKWTISIPPKLDRDFTSLWMLWNIKITWNLNVFRQ